MIKMVTRDYAIAKTVQIRDEAIAEADELCNEMITEAERLRSETIMEADRMYDRMMTSIAAVEGLIEWSDGLEGE